MSIQWFPGHMYKTRKKMQERLRSIDLVIEVLDARLPSSSLNPLIERITGDKIKLKLLNKADLADPIVTKLWLEYFTTQQVDTRALAITSNNRLEKERLISHCRSLLPHRGGIDKPLRIMICGIPNVGKSTLINQLAGRVVAKAANEAGITQDEQRIVLKEDVWLYDTPGMLWEKIRIPENGYRLAIAGSVGKRAYNPEEAALHLLSYLKKHYQDCLVERYSLEPWQQARPAAEDWLYFIAEKRGTFTSARRVDYQRASELILQDFRSGKLGLISLERPSEWLCWQQAAAQESDRLKGQKEKKQWRKTLKEL
ncbi:MAG: ribosome biogenesis GTPase YlqF [Neisseriaceae bacterium]